MATHAGAMETLVRNVMRGFGTSQVDFASHRQFHLVDRVNLQIRSEFFNVNQPTFGSIRRSAA